MSYTIRTATLQDAALLANLGRQTYSDAFSAQNTPETMSLYLANAFSPQKQSDELADPDTIFLIVQDENQTVGYARLKTGRAPVCVTSKHPLEIIRFYAVKEYIGRGVGNFLMEACLAKAHGRNCDVVWLGVWQQNQRGIAFYRKWGFKIVGEQGFQMGDEIQQDHIMARVINKSCE